MRNLGLIAMILLLFGCDTEVDLIYEADAIPIVYCLLDPGEEIQTIRLSKSFITEQGETISDSTELYYYQDDVRLAIEKMEGDKAVQHTEFAPVTINKESGFFPGQYHIVYQSRMEIATNTVYRLVIYLEKEDKLIYAFTTTPGDFTIIAPSHPEVRALHFSVDHNPVFHWTPSENVHIYQLGFQFNYYETDSTGSLLKSLLVPLKTIVLQNNPGWFYSFDINSTKFYASLGSLLDAKPEVLRSFQSIDAIVIAGGEELAVHFQLEKEGDPFRMLDYSNIQNGIGVFSGIGYSYSRGFRITDQSIDSLAYGRFTHELNFLDRYGNRKGK